MDVSSIQELAFIGAPIQFKDICFIYPITIKEIILMGNNKFQQYLAMLTMTQYELESLYKKKNQKIPNNLNCYDNLMASCKNDKRFSMELSKSFYTFIKEDINIIPDIGVVIGDYKDKRIINKENFLEFTNIIRTQSKQDIVIPPPENETPMEKKFRLRREAREAVKKRTSNKENDETISFARTLSALCVYDATLTPSNVSNMTYYAYKELLELYRAREEYNNSLSDLRAGADPKKVKVKYWMTYK